MVQYDEFLSKHGGGSNAFTDAEYTCYHFDVNHNYLKPALDRYFRPHLNPGIAASHPFKAVTVVHRMMQVFTVFHCTPSKG